MKRMVASAWIGWSRRRAVAADMRASARRLGLALLAVALMLAIGAPVASAIIVHLSSGRTLSYQPLRGAALLGGAELSTSSSTIWTTAAVR